MFTTKPEYLIEKEKSLNLTDEERRRRATGALVTLDHIENWTEYFKKHQDRLNKFRPGVFVTKFNIQFHETKLDFNQRVSIWKGDITKLEVDAIVNAANNSLLGGGGVDGAIHKAAGKFLLEECKTLNGCETGDAKMTGGYDLPAKYIIHTVGPQGEYPKLLEAAYNSCMKRLVEKNLKTIAFPCISTGVYGYPQDSAANVALKTVRNFLDRNPAKIERVVFCLFLPRDVEIYETMMQAYFPVD